MTAAKAGVAIGSQNRWTTMREIAQQPAVWRAHGPTIDAAAHEIRTWLAGRSHDEVWFCGAGTSAFIGETLAARLNSASGPARFRAVPTTDLISCPRDFLRPGLRLLVVQFGRSGNSPETLGALDLLATHAPQADRLHITCNGAGALAKSAGPGPGELRTIVLPPETEDQGFAMTSSYTTMLLAALACFDTGMPTPAAELFSKLAEAADAIITQGLPDLATGSLPERAVFLGSGALTGSARECALKVLELTAGSIATSWDSPLGFRHGPKAVIRGGTKVFVLLSGDPHTRAYDQDLAAELGEQFGADTVVRLGDASAGAHIEVPTIGGDAWASVLYVIVAQMLAVAWSDRLDLNVDDPFSGRNLTRVVAGVKLYPLPKPERRAFGAIDLGGSKIESCLFDDRLGLLARRRVATCKDSYAQLLDAVLGEVRWLEERGGTAMPVGIGIPGLVDVVTGASITANLPATGHKLSADLSNRLGRPTPVENDCKCFALSEANGGAGAGARTVFGLVLGTGVGGGVCVDGKLVVGLNGLPGEVGHLGLPAATVARHRLPLIACGCGRTGCYETLISGPGMRRIAEHVSGRAEEPPVIVALAAAGDDAMGEVLDIWFSILAELIYTVQLTIDADCVVLGGGLSRIEGVAERLAEVFPRCRMPGVRSPKFAVATFGDASGVRGAAMLVRTAAEAGLA